MPAPAPCTMHYACICGSKFRIPKSKKKTLSPSEKAHKISAVNQPSPSPKPKKKKKMTHAQRILSPDFPYDTRKIPKTSNSSYGPPDQRKTASKNQSIFKRVNEFNGKKTKNRSKIDFKKMRKELRHTREIVEKAN